jgi:hypothetical protein
MKNADKVNVNDAVKREITKDVGGGRAVSWSLHPSTAKLKPAKNPGKQALTIGFKSFCSNIMSCSFIFLVLHDIKSVRP